MVSATVAPSVEKLFSTNIVFGVLPLVHHALTGLPVYHPADSSKQLGKVTQVISDGTKIRVCVEFPENPTDILSYFTAQSLATHDLNILALHQHNSKHLIGLWQSDSSNRANVVDVFPSLPTLKSLTHDELTHFLRINDYTLPCDPADFDEYTDDYANAVFSLVAERYALTL